MLGVGTATFRPRGNKSAWRLASVSQLSLRMAEKVDGGEPGAVVIPLSPT